MVSESKTTPTVQNKPKPLISDRLYDQITKLVLQPALKGQSVTVITFKKAGMPFNLKHAIELQLAEGRILPDTMFIWLPMGSAVVVTDLVLQVLLNLKRIYATTFKSHVLEILNSILKKDSISQGEFLAFFDFLANDEKSNLIFVFKSFDEVYGHDSQKNTADFVESLYKHCKSYANFIFLTNSDFQNLTAQPTQTFWGEFQSNIVWGSNFIYDDTSVKLSAENFQQKNDVTLASKFVSTISMYSHGDPAVVLYSFYQTLTDKSLEEKIASLSKPGEVYNSLGPDFLDWRFNLIIAKMADVEIEALKLGNTKVRYVTKSGLISQSDEKILYLNPLFEHFVKYRLKRGNFVHSTTSHIAKTVELSGQELLTYNLLSSHPGEIVSKDQIAAAIWGETWEQKYSDWAIDKLISNLKKKLVDIEKPAKLQSFKKLGVMLVPLNQALPQ